MQRQVPSDGKQGPRQPFRRARRSPFALVPLALMVPLSGSAQQTAAEDDCDGWRGWRRGSQFCEVREMTLPATGALAVDAGPNGGIEVGGTDRSDVQIRAIVRAWGDDEDAAREIAEQVVIRTDGVVTADGPTRSRDWSWSVSYEILTPRDTDLDLETRNGGITVDDVRGTLDLDAVNGGIRLDAVAGDVTSRTTNGGIDITLTGDRWDGQILDAETTNGGVRVRVPENYSARLEAATVNGGLDIDFPVTVRGRIGREISTTLGDGGALVRVETTNGGVRISSY